MSILSPAASASPPAASTSAGGTDVAKDSTPSPSTSGSMPLRSTAAVAEARSGRRRAKPEVEQRWASGKAKPREAERATTNRRQAVRASSQRTRRQPQPTWQPPARGQARSSRGLLAVGYRDKFFVKVYAAAFYVDYSLRIDTEQWKEKIGIESFDGSSVFYSIFKAPVVKSLSIILVRAVDGKTFVNALNDVIAHQIKNPNAEEESSLSTLQNTFLGRNLKQGTSIYLTWLEPKRMLISISENQDPRQVDAEIESATVNYALYDGFFGKSPVSPSLRSSTAQLLEALLL
ncbi:fatty-acid-binding protein 3, chloroplastic-like [Miscanthus floridulus]|uniref:fatty-acid-binding protein 3, chloroplastic-like n=1 Tax=Miscanthus floridulus TaxID=154761 RepID=UPI003459B71E